MKRTMEKHSRYQREKMPKWPIDNSMYSKTHLTSGIGRLTVGDELFESDRTGPDPPALKGKQYEADLLSKGETELQAPKCQNACKLLGGGAYIP